MPPAGPVSAAARDDLLLNAAAGTTPTRQRSAQSRQTAATRTDAVPVRAARRLYADRRLRDTSPTPVTDADLAALFSSATMRRANMGLRQLCDLIDDDDAERVLLPRIGEILRGGGVLEAHRTLLDRLVALSQRPAAETASRSVFASPLAATPADVAAHMVSVQREVLQRLERWGRRSRDRDRLAAEAHNAYQTLAGTFRNSRYGMDLTKSVPTPAVSERAEI